MTAGAVGVRKFPINKAFAVECQRQKNIFVLSLELENDCMLLWIVMRVWSFQVKSNDVF